MSQVCLKLDMEDYFKIYTVKKIYKSLLTFHRNIGKHCSVTNISRLSKTCHGKTLSHGDHLKTIKVYNEEQYQYLHVIFYIYQCFNDCLKSVTKRLCRKATIWRLKVKNVYKSLLTFDINIRKHCSVTNVSRLSKTCRVKTLSHSDYLKTIKVYSEE